MTAALVEGVDLGEAQPLTGLEIAVIVPCYNEAVAVGKVVAELQAALPSASIYVYDNNSSDETAAKARAAGAIVRHVPRKGKGNVIRRAFADVEADIYVLIDGDDTYDASRAAELVRTLLDGPHDQVVGVRQHSNVAAYRPGHTLGNRLLTGAAGTLFGREITDMLSGYRAFSRRYVKSFPALSREFEIETELTIHSLHLRVPVAEVPVGYKERPDGGKRAIGSQYCRQQRSVPASTPEHRCDGSAPPGRVVWSSWLSGFTSWRSYRPRQSAAWIAIG